MSFLSRIENFVREKKAKNEKNEPKYFRRIPKHQKHITSDQQVNRSSNDESPRYCYIQNISHIWPSSCSQSSCENQEKWTEKLTGNGSSQHYFFDKKWKFLKTRPNPSVLSTQRNKMRKGRTDGPRGLEGGGRLKLTSAYLLKQTYHHISPLTTSSLCLVWNILN